MDDHHHNNTRDPSVLQSLWGGLGHQKAKAEAGYSGKDGHLTVRTLFFWFWFRFYFSFRERAARATADREIGQDNRQGRQLLLPEM